MRKDIDKTNEKLDSLSFSQFKSFFPSTENLKLPTVKALKNMDVPIVVSLKTEEGTLTVYRNGFFSYKTKNGHATVYAVDRCGRIALNPMNDDTSNVLDETNFGDCPWPKVLEFAASERIASNISRNVERHEILSIDVASESWDAQMSIGSNFETPTEEGTEREQGERLLRKIKAVLTDRQWEVFRLYYAEDMTQEEVADHLGIKRIPVRKHLIAAQKKIQRVLEGDK